MPRKTIVEMIAETLEEDRLLDAALEYVRSNMSPEDVFTDRELRDWATNNGFKEDEE